MFQCTQCGQCCRNLQHSAWYADLDRGDGVCRYLQGNLCSIYETRPLKCRIDEGYEAFYKEQMSKEEYYQLNYAGCALLQQQPTEEKENALCPPPNGNAPNAEPPKPPKG